MFTRLRRGALQQSESDNRPRKHFRSVAVVIGLLSLVFTLVSPVPPGYAANITDGFQPGNIVSDGNFYDGNAMSASEVQSFLNSQVSRCTIGDAGRAAGSKWYNTTISTHCVQNLRMTTKSMPSNQFCAAYAGATNETGAQIIAKVGKACGVSQKALLVMLQKEQGVITDSWPTVIQMDWAMGYACPDTAPCDTEYKGFFNQVYKAAWQLKVYKAYPNSYRYKAGQTNTIQWHPEAGCGTSQVYIENSATAGLYIYTPYRPNQAALNAGWGTGDGCSSYGNRNFYNYYKAWFGAPLISLDARFSALYSQLGGALGVPTSNATNVSGGVRQELEKGTLYWHSSTGAVATSGGIRTTLNSVGGVAVTGFPTGGEVKTPLGWKQYFQKATILWSNERGGQLVAGGINAFFVAKGESEKFGLPLGGQRKNGEGWEQDFDSATIMWSSATGGSFVSGGIRDSFVSYGGPKVVGYPTGLQEYAYGAWRQDFQSGRIYWRSSTGGRLVTGGIRTAFDEFGGAPEWGNPLSEQEVQVGGQWTQLFDSGLVTWSREGGGAVLSERVGAVYLSEGHSFAGYPTGKPKVHSSGEVNRFTRGDVYSSPGTDVVLVSGGIRNQLLAAGGVETLGFPRANEVRQADSSWEQEFERGTIIWSAGGGGAVIGGEILQYYRAMQSSKLGFPQGIERVDEVGRCQEFTRGTVYQLEGSSPEFVTGGIRTFVLRMGGVSKTGYPLAPEENIGGGVWQQQFEYGVIQWSNGGSKFTPNK